MEQPFSKNTLFNFFSGNATPLQKKAIEEWLKQEPNLEWFFEYLKEWENEHPQFLADTDQAYEQLRSNLKSNHSRTKSKLSQQIPNRSFNIWMVAASVFLMFACTFLLFKDAILYKTYTTAFGEVRTFSLEDGSHVALNANSSLRVPRYSFNHADREVFLAGEAEFSVKHTPTHQKFIVTTPDKMSVEVLGTQFIVYSRARASKVILQTGKVRVSNASNQSLTIVPGDIVTMDQKGLFKKESAQAVQIYSAWKNRRFIFDHTSLKEVTLLIEENFGIKVHLSDATLADRSITGTFQANNALEMLEMLSDVSDLRISGQNQVYTLSTNE
jgi:ferric-dicitrate binding protein FerR (iron transport regulator)